ncbi:hypothetical protein CYY_006029 [Polysphondylium violaceum]|uniref:Phorbol-ester/DAG-type domain-containing protein n=1 Tax=Polysphondylium violaceum TaxID=133409 RepID=A0A8J4PTB4_9MYCE|nr:hypothetical protein CYY_006029 [Polysphondylium violaceum]
MDPLPLQHDWAKKHFNTPPYCFICSKLIWGAGKLAYYCKSCHVTCHYECNTKSEHIPSFCTVVKHDWSKDSFDTNPTCSGCNNIIFSHKGKAHGFSCSKCNFKSHKNCKNLCGRCESTKSSTSLLSLIKSSSESSSKSSGTLESLFTPFNMSIDLNNPVISPSGAGDPNSPNPNRLSRSVWSANQQLSASSNNLPVTSISISSSVASIPSSPNLDSSQYRSLARSVDLNSPRFNSLVASGSLSIDANASIAGGLDDVMFELDNTFIPRSVDQKRQFFEKMKFFLLCFSYRLDPEYNLYINDIKQQIQQQADKLSSSTTSSSSRPSSPTPTPTSTPTPAAVSPLDFFYGDMVKYRSISQVFHSEMLTSGRVRSAKQYDHYKSLFECLLIMYSNYWDEDSDSLYRLAMDIYTFLSTHKVDPENILIGMTPSKEIQRRVKKHFYPTHLDLQQKAPSKFKGKWDLRISRSSLIDNITTWGQIENKDSLMKVVKEFSKHLENEKYKEGDIIIAKLPKNWNDKQQASSVNDPLSSSSSTPLLGVISDSNHHEFDEGSFILGRFIKEADPLGLNCLIYIQADELKPLRIPTSRLVSFRILDIIVPSEKNRIERLITNPFDAFITELRSAVKETTKARLAERGYNVALIGQGLLFNGVQCSNIEGLNKLRKMISSFDSLPEYLTSIDTFSHEATQFFLKYLKSLYMSEMNGNHCIYFNREETLNHPIINLDIIQIETMSYEYDLLHNSSNLNNAYNSNSSNSNSGNSNLDQDPSFKYFSSLKNQYIKFKPYLPNIKSMINEIETGRKYCITAKDSLTGLVSECDLAIDTINNTNTRIFDSTKKRELTNWYLQLIRETIDSYLKETGYDGNAVPENYIDRPPQSLSKVRENLRIVNLVLKPNNKVEFEHRLQRLILPLKKKIYAGIDEFLSAAEILFVEKLKEHKAMLESYSDEFVIVDDIQECDLRSTLALLKSVYLIISNSPVLTPTGGNNNNPGSSSSSPVSQSSSPLYTTASTSPSSPLSFSTLSNALRSSSGGLDQPIIATGVPGNHIPIVLKLYNLVEDIVYIREMRSLEEKFYSNEILSECTWVNDKQQQQQNQALSNIVPITGLIFSRLLRLKHELRTVLEVWESNKLPINNYVPLNSSPSSQSSSSTLSSTSSQSLNVSSLSISSPSSSSSSSLSSSTLTAGNSNSNNSLSPSSSYTSLPSTINNNNNNNNGLNNSRVNHQIIIGKKDDLYISNN